MYKHETTIYWSDEDQLVIAEVPALPGCIEHGKTNIEALQNSKDAIDLLISTAKEFGAPVPVPSRHAVP